MKKFLLALVFSALALTQIATAQAEPNVGFGELYYEGTVVRTVVPPASSPKRGVDNFYAVPNQLAVIAVAPGDRRYHGGKWAWHNVSWNVTPYTLTSEADVLAAAASGDVTIERLPSMDFKCPVQP